MKENKRFVCPLNYAILGDINYILQVHDKEQSKTDRKTKTDIHSCKLETTIIAFLLIRCIHDFAK